MVRAPMVAVRGGAARLWPGWRLLACLMLGGCVTNTLTAQTAQTTPAGGVLAAVRVPPPPSAPRGVAGPGPTARMAAARLVTTHETTTGGATLLLASPLSLDRDCASLGRAEVKVTEPPEHGAVHVEPGMAFPRALPGDPPSLCAAHRAPATIVTYRAEPGFVGEDATVIQIFFPSGQAPMVRFDISVR